MACCESEEGKESTAEREFHGVCGGLCHDGYVQLDAQKYIPLGGAVQESVPSSNL